MNDKKNHLTIPLWIDFETLPQFCAIAYNTLSKTNFSVFGIQYLGKVLEFLVQKETVNSPSK